jgi:Transposase zinc-ribbon domain
MVHTEKIAQASVTIWWSYPWVSSQLLLPVVSAKRDSSIDECLAQDFPKSLREFQSKFATEQACQQYLAACRRPEGFVCPRCGLRRAYELANLIRWQCAGCRYQVSLAARTILRNTKTPLTVWFWAAYLMTTDKRGLSALLLAAPACFGALRDSLDDAAQVPAGYDQSDPRTTAGRSGRYMGWRYPSWLAGSRQVKGRKAALVLVAVEKRGRNTTKHLRRADERSELRAPSPGAHLRFSEPPPAHISAQPKKLATRESRPIFAVLAAGHREEVASERRVISAGRHSAARSV